MKKRLRKKKRLGEFQAQGFAIEARLRPEVVRGVREKFLDRWTHELERHGLAFRRDAPPPLFGGFVQRGDDGSATEGDRQAVSAWLSKDAAVLDHRVGPLVAVVPAEEAVDRAVSE